MLRKLVDFILGILRGAETEEQQSRLKKKLDAMQFIDELKRKDEQDKML